ncbi:hypothetical protein D7X94_18040, partial [Acutalibacter sp. 1XD8-33]|uniref:hypothetical protein n=1 Tax=Acutalibacter sp. 1XD8-33 TaxID=2320081 RepID=UPI000EDA10B1
RVQKCRFSSKGGARAFWESGFGKPVKKSIKDMKKCHFSVIRFTPEGNHKGDNSVPKKSQVGETIYPRLSGKTQHCE